MIDLGLRRRLTPREMREEAYNLATNPGRRRNAPRESDLAAVLWRVAAEVCERLDEANGRESDGLAVDRHVERTLAAAESEGAA